MHGIKETSIFKYNTQIVDISTKMLNERKVAITAKLSFEYNAYERQELKFYNDFENIEALQKQEESIDMNSVVGINSARTSLKENIIVDSMDNVAEILKSDINVTNIESKISYNKVLAKAEANISIIYLTEDDRISKVDSSFPVMSFIEIPNVKDDNICDLDYKMRNVLLKVNSTEDHSILAQADFEITAQVFEKRRVNIVSDLYSLNKDVTFSKKEVELEVSDEANGEIVKIDEKIEIENLKRVLAVDSRAVISNTKDAEVQLKIYYETTEKNGLNVKAVNIPFMAKNLEDADVRVNKKDFDIDSNNMILQMELELRTKTKSSRKIPVIEDTKCEDIKDRNDYSVVVYFVKPNDTIWKIAKKFKVTMDSIIKINNLDNPDLIYPGDKLYVIK